MITDSELRNLTDSQLKRELERRKQKREDEVKKSRKNSFNLIKSKKDELSTLITHQTKACQALRRDSFHPEHGVVDCPRCFLENMEDHEHDAENIEILIDVVVQKYSDG